MQFDVAERSIAVGQWQRRASWIRYRSPEADPRLPAISALVGIRQDVNLLIEVDSAPDAVWMEAWVGEPYESDGLAVVAEHENLVGVARIPLCPCGDHACGNSGVQLACHLPAEALPVMVELLEGLPDTNVVPVRGQIWTGHPPYAGF